MRRNFIVLTVLAVASSWQVASAQALSVAPPTYSFTEDPGFSLMGTAVIKVSRDGPKEVIDQVMPPGPDATRSTTAIGFTISRHTKSI